VSDDDSVWTIGDVDTCPRCGADADDLTENSDGSVSCSECADSVLVERRRVRRAVDAIESEASSHGSNYAAGMRLARMLTEQELLGLTRVDEDLSRYSASPEE